MILFVYLVVFVFDRRKRLCIQVLKSLDANKDISPDVKANVKRVLHCDLIDDFHQTSAHTCDRPDYSRHIFRHRSKYANVLWKLAFQSYISLNGSTPFAEAQNGDYSDRPEPKHRPGDDNHAENFPQWALKSNDSVVSGDASENAEVLANARAALAAAPDLEGQLA